MIIRFLQLGFIVSLAVLTSCSSVTGIDNFGNFRSEISDESLSQDTKELFKLNAAVLTFRDQKENYSSSLYLPEDLQSFYYDIQVHIAASETGKEYSTITSATRVFESTNLNELLLKPKKDYPFVERWEKGLIYTGVNEIDELLQKNDFYVKSLLDLHNSNLPIFILKRDQPINTLIITRELPKTGYFKYVGTNGFSGPSTDINFERKNAFLEVSYKVCTGGSISGCTRPEIYTFKVLQDGEVIFEGKNINL